MPRRLLLLNVVLGIVSLAFAVGIVRTLLVKHPMPRAAASRPAVAPQPSVTAGTADPGPEAYAVIATQNLFNPSRIETATAAVAVVKPILHGVVIDGAKSRAFLEDPTVKRIGGYSVGDTVSGGKLQRITDDRVVIARPEGLMEVLLQDPSKPRPAPTASAVPVVPAAPGQLAPGQLGTGQPVPGQFAPVQAAPGTPPNQPAPTGPQSRRRLPPQGQPTNE
jgi:hypothetical protein